MVAQAGHSAAQDVVHAVPVAVEDGEQVLLPVVAVEPGRLGADDTEHGNGSVQVRWLRVADRQEAVGAVVGDGAPQGGEVGRLCGRGDRDRSGGGVR
ncbi:hypothetical protein [Streptomyces sp. GC420]|uniref:hypothetical protein n=1 Tax=Streptomyces sp. GC420 TaxID=2697568 RepID=UPI001414CCE5|nr:hypothetical protein [Streptomyces sp. GC420]NBM19048.1 hypothetical protein [Streptomyces sp. GC420]